MPTICADERTVFDQPQDGEIVGQRVRGGNHFDEVGLERGDAVCCPIQAAGAREIVKAHQQSSPRGSQVFAKPGQLRGLGLLCRFNLEIDDLAAGLGGLGKYR